MITALPRIAIAVEDFEQAMSFFRGPLGLADADISVPSARTGEGQQKGYSSVFTILDNAGLATFEDKGSCIPLGL